MKANIVKEDVVVHGSGGWEQKCRRYRWTLIGNGVIAITCIASAYYLAMPSRKQSKEEDKASANGMFSGASRVFTFDAMVGLFGVVCGALSIRRQSGRTAAYYYYSFLYNMFSSFLEILAITYILCFRRQHNEADGKRMLVWVFLWSLFVFGYRIWAYSIIKFWKKTFTQPDLSCDKPFVALEALKIETPLATSSTISHARIVVPQSYV